jgi:hypothetical protein
MGTIWQVLGIAETAEVREIKRAYAAKVKVTSPERDPAGYMKLRDAYEAAKAFAENARYAAEFEASQRDDSNREADPANEQPEDVAPAAEPVPVDAPPSPQRQVFDELRALLEARKLEESLQKIAAIQADQVFASLDDQHDFIGMVALLVQHLGIEEQPWRGRLAAQLGARDYDNIFPQDSRYWFAYRALLQSYAEVRAVAAHVQARDQDGLASTPGYLHVFHVLTAPFDSERLTALTRSQTYHRLAESILQRAKTDTTIVIPPENRDWWERTAMAGQHRPTEQPATANAAPTGESGSSFPTWVIWPMVMLLLTSLRLCGDSSPTTHYDPEQTRRLIERLQTQSQSQVGETVPDLMTQRHIESCDENTRLLIRVKLLQIRRERQIANPADPDLGIHELEKDPQIATLLAKCPDPLRETGLPQFH